MQLILSLFATTVPKVETSPFAYLITVIGVSELDFCWLGFRDANPVTRLKQTSSLSFDRIGIQIKSISNPIWRVMLAPDRLRNIAIFADDLRR